MTRRAHISHRVKWAVAVRQNFKCALCAGELAEEVNLDHKRALSDGGTDDVLNLQLLCLTCHHRKTVAETVARNRGTSEYHCLTCGHTYSRHFIHEHIHARAGMRN